MALTDKRKHEIIFYLGWPAKTLLVNSTHYSNTIADRLINLDATIEAVIDTIIGQLQKVDKQLEAARCRLIAAKVDDITLNSGEIPQLLKERKRYIRELHQTTDVPIVSDNTSMVSVEA